MKAVIVALLALVAVVSAQWPTAPWGNNGCNACNSMYPACLYCPATNGNGVPSTGCFPANYRSYTCCGCVNGACTTCPSSSSCATWSPYNPTYCPASSPNSNSTFFPSYTNNYKIQLRYQEKSVWRTHSVPVSQYVNINWNVRPNSDGEFMVWVLDRNNFDNMLRGGSFNCLNQNCGQAGSAPKYGQITVYGSAEYFTVVTKTNDNFSGSSSYYVTGFVQRA